MDLRKKKINLVYDALISLRGNDEFAYFYDRDKSQIESIPASWLDEEFDIFGIDENSIFFEILSDNEQRFVPIYYFDEEEIIDSQNEFINLQNNNEISNEFYKIIGKKNNQLLFKNLLIKYNLREKYDAFLDEITYSRAEDILTSHHVIVKKASNEYLKQAYEIADRIGGMELWKIIYEEDVIELDVDNQFKIYFCFMGNAGKCYGLSIYLDDQGLNSLSLMAKGEEYGIDQLMTISLQNCITIYFEEEGEASKEEFDLIKKIGYKRKSKYLTSINRFEPGFFLTTDIDDKDCIFVIRSLEMLFAGLSRLNGLKLDEDESLRIVINGDDVSLEKIDKIILSYDLKEELLNKRDDEYQITTKDGTCEFNLSVINIPMMKDDFVTPMWVYNLVILDYEEGILNIIQNTNDEENIFQKMQDDVMDFFEEKEIARDIIVNNPILESILAPYSDICAITVDEPSEDMNEILENINNLANEPEEIN